MTSTEFISLIKNFKVIDKPKDIKIIFGLANFYDDIQKYEPIKGQDIDIYSSFGSYAFTLDNKCTYIGSDTYIWRILLNNKIDVVDFFTSVKKPKDETRIISISELIHFLFYHEGIVLLNRDIEKSKFEIFKNNYNVTDVLFVGKDNYKSLTKYFSDETRFGLIYHPSGRAGLKGRCFYDTLDSSVIEEVSNRNKRYQKTNFKAFAISLFAENNKNV